MKNRPISFDDVISNRVLDQDGWRDMTEEERQEALNQIKEVLIKTCRGINSEVYRAITRLTVNNLPPNAGIFKRLTVNGYVAGQSYPDEINFIKQYIKRYC